MMHRIIFRPDEVHRRATYRLRIEPCVTCWPPAAGQLALDIQGASA